jgi:uncharacterized protein (TIGR02145 family)
MKSVSLTWLSISAVSFTLLIILALQGCQKDEGAFTSQDSVELKCKPVNSEMPLYYGPKIFSRGPGKPFISRDIIKNPNYYCYDNLVLKVQNGWNRFSRVASAEIKINGVVIVRPCDFSKNVFIITKPLPDLGPEAELEVRLFSAPCSFIRLWIEGNVALITPVFTQIGPVVQNSDAPELPATSENGITGTWNPSMVSTDAAGVFTFTFTPDEGQCALPVTMTIEVINKGTITDIDGNVYKTVKIGDQWWMADNLRVTKFRNGDPIPTTSTPKTDISSEGSPKYQWSYTGYDNYISTYGRLYTWFAATDSRGVCPDGWHVPTDAEWTTLSDFLTANGYGFEGSGDDVAKSMASQSEWLISDTPGTIGNDPGSNNSSGFSGMPGGYRIADGRYTAMFYTGIWLSSDGAWVRSLQNTSDIVHRNELNRKHATSVRCVKD